MNQRHESLNAITLVIAGMIEQLPPANRDLYSQLVNAELDSLDEMLSPKNPDVDHA